MAVDRELLRQFYDLKQLLSDKWAPAILVTLAEGRMRRVDILSTIHSFSYGEEWSDRNAPLQDSILARTLKRMTEEGLLVRTEPDTTTFPPEVYYSLTPPMEEFLAAVGPVREWSRRHADLIGRAQAHRRRQSTGADGTGE
ncbi:helix-turn-helix transcriptional regulator [Amycolatopsis sp. K13G38]|uniref:Helix-turn-helix transcriptional regulator n=1 Tax=Amycolatopsis acididurans TaxID=2724524 RepID=A0ABX1JH84_9PSEU|nr:winged helix-turn-helix transcriptional regulator [Amycolatopsis acididurans]NKQ59016.1 helix-turn-helix transcriptional regulator [Amycolatopsis acididurans]